MNYTQLTAWTGSERTFGLTSSFRLFSVSDCTSGTVCRSRCSGFCFALATSTVFFTAASLTLTSRKLHICNFFANHVSNLHSGDSNTARLEGAQ